MKIPAVLDEVDRLGLKFISKCKRPGIVKIFLREEVKEEEKKEEKKKRESSQTTWEDYYKLQELRHCDFDAGTDELTNRSKEKAQKQAHT